MRLQNTSLTPDLRYGLLIEILQNLVLLLPAGFLLPLTLNRRVKMIYGLLFGLVVSATIEVTQLVTCRGLFEYDDMIGNSIGCMAGCLLSSRIFGLMNRRQSVLQPFLRRTVLTRLVTCRGLFEYDDMIGNSMGCMVGCGSDI